jgi:putative acetyltransferase
VYIRIATNLDRDGILAIYSNAFPEVERSIVSKLAINLLADASASQSISLVAEAKSALVGHIAFSPVVVDDNENLKGYILAPLGVKQEYQQRRIGSQLVESGMQRLLTRGVDLLFVYGDPDYYGRFGFSVAAATPYIPPYPLQYPFGWQAMVLNERNFDESPVKIECVTPLCDPVLW